MRKFIKDKLEVRIFDNRDLLGASAAETISEKITALLKTNRYVNIIFASAPSQNEFLSYLLQKPIDWSCVNAFHMDEYIGLNADAPQAFGTFLKQRLFDKVKCNQVHYLNGNDNNPLAECKRYSELLKKYPTDIVCLGIGENTHLAFNDPHVADFRDEKIVKVIDLDMDCRMQQVNDGCFETLEQVPTHALTITIPALFKAQYAYAIVPGKSKAKAIYHTIESDISERYPSTILRRHPNAILFIDKDSAAKLSTP